MREKDAVWECGRGDFGTRTPLLPNAPICETQSEDYLEVQYQAGPPEEASFRLPDGFGIPVGDKDSSVRSVVTAFHFFHTEDLTNGSTAGSAVEITFRTASAEHFVAPVFHFTLFSQGFLGPHSVDTISGSWTHEGNATMRLLMLYTHWHDLATDVVVWIEKRDGGKDVILHQDPRSFWGMNDVFNASRILESGDRLTIRCTYNNTESNIVHVL